jgi:lambda repressor-like predicted transcriptional regulator
MKRRILAIFLWFYAWWYAGAIVADVLGVSPMLGPIIGAVAAALFVGDPRKIVWPSRGIDRARAKQRLT